MPSHDLPADLKDQEIDPLREGLLTAYLEGAKKKISKTIQQA